ncbi:MAG TPA: hypothetical protein VJH95_02710 [Candidatus Nanoarchaeia archaeon]|nr:hypothetical protein [Candidatus Nanoarchaeia archaeon]
MVKCELCKKTIDETFLGKLIGTYMMEGRRKKAVCRECQRTNSLEEIRKKLK